jgi:hypothetical protein
LKHKKDGMIDIRGNKCQHDGCNIHPCYNFSDQSKALFCFAHKKDGMIDIRSKKCAYNDCTKRPHYNHPYEKIGLYCLDHKLDGMISILNKSCQEPKCKQTATHGILNGKKQYCADHKKENMVNLDIENKCISCNNEYEFIIDDKKYCLEHCPNKDYEIKIKKKCKICDIEQNSDYICKDCAKLANKKEWAIVRHIRKYIDTPFSHNSSKQINECSNKRPDVFFELAKHVVIVEIDENQHKSYSEICECARINQIVSSIGGKSVIFIRYNPDKIKHKNKLIEYNQKDKLELLINTIKHELSADYNKICVKMIQLFFDDDNKKYQKIKEMDITKVVMI